MAATAAEQQLELLGGRLAGGEQAGGVEDHEVGRARPASGSWVCRRIVVISAMADGQRRPG